MEKTIWADLVKNYERDVAAKENRLHMLQGMKVDWIVYMLHRKCFSKQVIEVKLEGTRRR
jgi:hypothetical protein